MNVFVIPSWYPSESNPSYGIFIKEQVQVMARLRPDWNIGVSCWGQGDAEKLLWVKDHFKNLGKIKKHSLDQFSKNEFGNIVEYYQPALSWTKRFRKGNLNEIIRCNELNLQHYQLEFGKPDLIYVQASYPGAIIGNHLSDRYDIPYMVHVRLGGFMFDHLLGQLGSMKKELIHSINSASRILTTSHFQGQELTEWISKSEVIHNPVDTSFFTINESNEGYILSIGRLEEEKGFDFLVEAIMEIPDVKLKIGGAGSKENQLRKQIIDAGLNDRVELLGELNRDEVKELIHDCQFLVLPSRYETFGNVLLEAMACGKPVVATKCGGPSEIVNEQTGYLCEVDQNDLAEKIQLMNAHFHEFDPRAIRASLESRFSSDEWIDQLESQFKELKNT